uniref:Uncharacterized protein n=1 Tax=Oryza brachyantha TaxID=4533 RepID=J3M575_ORYBR
MTVWTQCCNLYNNYPSRRRKKKSILTAPTPNHPHWPKDHHFGFWTSIPKYMALSLFKTKQDKKKLSSVS